MSLSQQFAAAIPPHHDAGAGALAIEVAEGDARFGVELIEADRLACALLHGVWNCDGAALADAQALGDLGDEAARRLCYLLEPLSPFELDQDRCVLQMRSTTTAATAQGKEYYELVFRGDRSATLDRYLFAAGQPREAVPMSFTRDVARRLVGDVADVLQET